MQPEHYNAQAKRKLSPTLISLIIIALIAAGAGVMYATSRKDTTQNSAPSTQSAASSQEGKPDSTASSNSTYTDGTYSATGNYSTPGGSESVSVTATLSSGKITSIKTTGSATGGNSAQYQAAFLSAYESKVIGKSIDEVSLSRVAGSSLTSSGFNAALEEIKKDAVS